MHFHDAIEVNYVFDGMEDIVTLNGKQYRPGSGDIIVFNRNVPHAFAPASDRAPYDSLTLIYPYDQLVLLYPRLASMYLILNTVEYPNFLRNISYKGLTQTFMAMWNVHNTTGCELSRISLRKLAYTVLENLFSSDYLRVSKNNYSNKEAKIEFLIECVSYISKHLSESINNSSIAKNLHVSESKLTHIFKAEMGTPVQSYLRNQRLSKAYDLLINQHKSVEVITSLVGFPNEMAFIKAFKSTYHLTPLQYLKISKNN